MGGCAAAALTGLGWKEREDLGGFFSVYLGRVLFFLLLIFFKSTVQAGDSSGHRVLGSADPGAAVRFRRLGAL